MACSCPPATTPSPKRQVAYTGTQSSTISGLSTTYVFNFTDDLVNEGDPYSFKYARFAAPVSGIYGFSLTSYLGTTGYIVYLELVFDGLPIAYLKTGHYTSRQYAMATNFVLVNMTQGMEVWPRYQSGSGYLYGDGVTTFSGYLLKEF